MLATFLILAVVMVVLMFWSRRQLQLFLAQHASIQDSHTFEAYKELVRSQMHGALIYLVVGFLGLLLSVALVKTGGLPMLGVVIAVNVPLMVFGFSNKQIEERIRALPCNDPAMADDVARVGTTWVKRALPDF